MSQLPERSIHLHYHQGTGEPSPTQGVVLQGPWRLVNQHELYHIDNDPEQRDNIAASHPQRVAALQQESADWWAEIANEFNRPITIPVGLDTAVTHLDSMDLHGDIAWHQAMVARAKRCSGHWLVSIAKSGRYRVVLRRWPAELNLSLNADMSPDAIARLVDAADSDDPPQQFAAHSASLHIGDVHVEQTVDPAAQEVVFEIDVSQQDLTTISAHFHHPVHGDFAAYFVEIGLIAPTA